MPHFLSPEWAQAFDAALDRVKVPGPGEEAGLAAIGGRFTVVQEIRGAPGGDLSLVLRVDDGSLRLTMAGAGDSLAAPEGDVTITLGYQDAAALSKGELVAADALAAGRIRVRGDLSVLVASQQMLASAQPYVQALAAETTY